MAPASNKPNADKPSYFVSYSRKHFYMAEWLAISLEHAGYNTWFDVQELLPGIRWEKAINDGLTQCAGVILVASQAALASPYVEKEWARVQDDGKRVCVCVVEDVDLPDRLKRPDVTVIDMRRNFRHALKQVKEFLDGKPVNNHHHLIRNSLRFGVYWATPGLIRNSVTAWLELAALNVLAALIMVVGLLTAGSRTAVAVLLPIAMCGYAAHIYWRWGHRYMHRQFTRQQHKSVIGAALVSLLAFGGGLLILGSDTTALNPIGLGLAACIGLLFILMLVGLSSGGHPIRYRWLPTGESSQIERRMRIRRLLAPGGLQLRRLFLAAIVPAWNLLVDLSRYVIDALPPIFVRHKDNPHPVRFALVHGPADEYLAQRVRFTMLQYGHTPVDKVENADYQLLVVSEATPESTIVAATQHPTPPVFILAAPIVLNGDSPEAKFQWLDYRRRSQTQLNAVARVLRTNANQDLTLKERIDYSETFLPLNFSSILFPQVLAYSLLGFQLVGAALVILATLTVLFVLMKIVAVSSLLFGALMLASGLWLIVVEHRIYHRRTQLRWAYASVVAGFGWLIAALIGGIALLINAIVAVPSTTDTTVQSDLLNILYVALIVTCAGLLIVIAELRLWLPAPGSLSDKAGTVRLSETIERKHWQPGLINVALLAALVCAIAYLMLNHA